jgi:hypothetical protein
MNGFTDWIKTVAGDQSYNAFRKGSFETGLKESALEFPASTIVFGEKASNSPALYLDLFKPDGFTFGTFPSGATARAPTPRPATPIMPWEMGMSRLTPTAKRPVRKTFGLCCRPGARMPACAARGE